MAERLETLRLALRLEKGELCDRLGIGRAMLHYIRTGERAPSMKLVRRIEDAEAEAGLRPIVPDVGKPREGPVQGLEGRRGNAAGVPGGGIVSREDAGFEYVAGPKSSRAEKISALLGRLKRLEEEMARVRADLAHLLQKEE